MDPSSYTHNDHVGRTDCRERREGYKDFTSAHPDSSCKLQKGILNNCRRRVLHSHGLVYLHTASNILFAPDDTAPITV